MKTLLEDYYGRLKAVNEMIADLKFKDDANPDYVRLKTKASCYRTIISELEREVMYTSDNHQDCMFCGSQNTIVESDGVWCPDCEEWESQNI